MAEFREAVRKRDRSLAAYEAHIQQMTGVDGVGDDGLRLDRREFYATKNALTELYFLEMGWHRNQGGIYHPELLESLGNFITEGLPVQHGIQLVVRKDGRAWRAWRRTASGWYFGVGGTDTLAHRWQYDGPIAPSSFPSVNTPGWTDVTRRSASPEWTKNDEPPMQFKGPNVGWPIFPVGDSERAGA